LNLKAKAAPNHLRLRLRSRVSCTSQKLCGQRGRVHRLRPVGHVRGHPAPEFDLEPGTELEMVDGVEQRRVHRLRPDQ
jgi:hypothetical protein